MMDRTQSPFPLSGAALIEEARAARQGGQEQRVRAHVRAILPRMKFLTPQASQNSKPEHGPWTRRQCALRLCNSQNPQYGMVRGATRVES
jgi:hypothetical protein